MEEICPSVEEIIVENTNVYIESVKDNYARESSARSTGIIEMKAVIGLLYLASCLKSSRLRPGLFTFK
jgi:hypothetical protein